MAFDEGTRGSSRRPPERPDPAFVRRLEDDSLWQSDRQVRPARSARPRRTEKRSRVLAIVALLLAALAITLTGVLAGSDDPGSGGGATPFSILPLPGETTVSTMEPEDLDDDPTGSIGHAPPLALETSADGDRATTVTTMPMEAVAER